MKILFFPQLMPCTRSLTIISGHLKFSTKPDVGLGAVRVKRMRTAHAALVEPTLAMKCQIQMTSQACGIRKEYTLASGCGTRRKHTAHPGPVHSAQLNADGTSHPFSGWHLATKLARSINLHAYLICRWQQDNWYRCTAATWNNGWIVLHLISCLLLTCGYFLRPRVRVWDTLNLPQVREGVRGGGRKMVETV